MSKDTVSPPKLPKEQNRARKKFLSEQFFNKMLEETQGSKQHHSYYRGVRCSNNISIHPDTGLAIREYCGHKLCHTCNGIYSAKYITTYTPALAKETDLQLLTVTVKTCTFEEAPQILKDLKYIVRQIGKKSTSKYGVKLRGIRKLEVNLTHENRLNPHLHLILATKEQAEWYQAEWLQRWENLYPNEQKVNYSAQDIKPIGDAKNDSKALSALLEITKYTQKIPTNIDFTFTDKKGRTVQSSPKIVDFIYNLLYGTRTLQSFGLKLNAEQTEEPLTEQIETLIEDTEELEIESKIFTEDTSKWGNHYEWNHQLMDWVSDDGTQLTNYSPQLHQNYEREKSLYYKNLLSK